MMHKSLFGITLQDKKSIWPQKAQITQEIIGESLRCRTFCFVGFVGFVPYVAKMIDEINGRVVWNGIKNAKKEATSALAFRRQQEVASVKSVYLV
ncbi:MAG: hypothetical protein QNK86_11275 [Akkermansiaceae bacterium]|jgi:hypothetical protein|tara:strand:- start:8664 stop:8948 length:285 start_codon:yes stop_codon:yes gene_type:complete